MFNSKNILITGGTGSFGKTFVRKMLKDYQPNKVIVFSRDELKQFEMQQELAHEFGEELTQKHVRFFIGDVRDEERLRMAFRGVDIVVHAAALKQVVAAEYNPMECLKTNVIGAENIVQAAIEQKVGKVIALSTDKAANPANLYGATKFLSDKLFVAGNNLAGSEGPRFAVVRYGNVHGSRGSIIPFFKRLVDNGATELPVTDERMTRFWITLEQGVEFVIKSFGRMQGGEIFVPKIPSIRITDVVKAFGDDITYRTIGIRPGEKLHECMCPKEIFYDTLEFDDHFVIKPTYATHQAGIRYRKNNLGEEGTEVADGFEYVSDTNPTFLSVEEIKGLIQ